MAYRSDECAKGVGKDAVDSSRWFPDDKVVDRFGCSNRESKAG